MAVTPLMYLIVLPMVLLGSFIDAAAGGGGLITLPAYLLAGLPPHLASGSNKTSALCGATAALIRFQRSGNVDWRAALPAVALALPGSYLGARLQMMLSPVAVRVMIAALLPLAAVPMLRSRDLAPRAPRSFRPFPRAIMCAGIGLVIGTYDGFFGPGTGTFLILAFTLLLGIEPVTASGSAKVVNLASNIAAFAAFAGSGQVLFPLALPAAACCVLGGALGAHFAVRRGAKLIRALIAVVLAILTVRIVYDVVMALQTGV